MLHRIYSVLVILLVLTIAPVSAAFAASDSEPPELASAVPTATAAPEVTAAPEASPAELDIPDEETPLANPNLLLEEDESVTPASPAPSGSPLLLDPSDSVVPLTIDGKPYAGTSILHDGITYVQLREFCSVMGEGVSVAWDGETQTVTVASPPISFTLNVADPYIVANGRYLYIPGGAVVHEGLTFVPVRTLAKAFGADCVWFESSQSIDVRRGTTPLESGDDFYDETDLYWLSRIISAEARGESLKGQIAVGNVVLNRAAAKGYPDTIKGVIFDRTGGVQFTPASNGTIYKDPTKNAVIAAKLALDGADIAGQSLFFLNAKIAASKWIIKNCVFVVSIGNHDFYSL
ncbi:MAG: cell wall hydrolase [Oscillospiraceae bacterium]|jgi:N-acetylmuramoyl-L-alanine amidase|nr:cell wall hydrolase [Oscillospiraceae bacterium]